jgi:phage gpG-like protein
MTFDELENYLEALPDQILEAAADITAETAVNSFKGNFEKKGFDGNPWEPAKVKKKTGSLLIESGELRKSVHSEYIGPDKVVIAAGGHNAPFAKVHNEGFEGSVSVPEHTRKSPWGTGTVNVKAHTRQANIPKRQFMGKSEEVAQEVRDAIQAYINSIEI